jgi:hypothetical protein
MPEQDNEAVETEVEDTESETTEEADEVTDPEGAEQLGDAGKKALDVMKRQMREERTKRRAAEAKLADLANAKPSDKPVSGEDGKAEDAPDADAIRREVEASVKAELGAQQARERVLDKIEVKAARSFTDPADAPLMLLREHKIEDFLDDDGKPDLEAIQDALKELLEKKPYLAAAQGGKRFQGNGDGGAKPVKPARPKSLDEAVKRSLSK